MPKVLLAVLLLPFCSFLTAQQALNDDAIVKMAKAGLSDELIVTTINASPGAYDTSKDGLIALMAAGVSDKVVAAIVLKSASSAPAPVATPVPAAPVPVSALPPGVNDVGIYYYQDDVRAWQEVSGELVDFESSGAAKHLFTATVIKEDRNGVIVGDHAQLLLKAPASFLFYMPQGRAPEDYKLLRLHINGYTRQFQSVAGGVAHQTRGAIRDDVQFSSKKLAPNAYQVVLSPSIGEGEYGFLKPQETSHKSRPSSAKIYTFSISK